MNQPSNDNFRLLRIYAYYRVALGFVLLALYAGEFMRDLPRYLSGDWFFITGVAYTALNLLTLISLNYRRQEPRQAQLVAFLLVDAIALTLLSGFSGGLANGLPMLLIITVAAGSIVLGRQLSIFIAASATVLTLAESVITGHWAGQGQGRIFVAGCLGIVLFATAILFQYLTQRIRESSSEAQRQAKAAAAAKDTAEKIIRRMRTGVIVLDRDQSVRLMNESARDLLGVDAHQGGGGLSIPAVTKAYNQWQLDPKSSRSLVTVSSTNVEIRLNFARLAEAEDGEILVFVEDQRSLSQAAQKLKLSSLGHLTASIAHEVRNPLGAISHAAQLLQEAPELTAQSQRLLDIILNHSGRVNDIIENTLQLSRRQHSQAEEIDLKAWLPGFVDEYGQTPNDFGRCDIKLSLPEQRQSVLTKFDLNQLKQVLTNLFDNGIRYSHQHTGHASLEVYLQQDHADTSAQLLVIDQGPGIDKDIEGKIFEPFFTTENSGSGLGLYICRELCQSNRAFLSYSPWFNQSCFRINFAHAQQIF